VPLADVVSRRVKLTKRGREFLGLCPFHNEKSPSFTVNEEKAFFHCFGCGAHGDIIEFMMRSEGLTFPETVERLAAQAGMEVPVASNEEREQAKQRHDLQSVMETACTWFETSLSGAGGAHARQYFDQRGLDGETIARFRLGFASDSRTALKEALISKGIPEEMLVTAGLLIRPEDGRETYDRFRDRVIFPITDPRGRVIAFGGRALGEAKAKYLNSPETPLFSKGRMLYAFAQARQPMFDSGTALVTEGYMDVIALHKAGFKAAVAPLGTALTEDQMRLLWRVVDEPILCFDGDTAGGRAAARAAERALPMLVPGKSLRFASLPAGEDPDSLIVHEGADAMARVIAAARPLSDMIWEIETVGHSLDTPERRAHLEKRLEDRVRQIDDRKVQDQYLRHFKDRLWTAFQASKQSKQSRPGFGRGSREPIASALYAGVPGAGAKARTDPRLLWQKILLATVINHPDMIGEIGEELGSLDFSSSELDKLRQETLQLSGVCDLDKETLARHLKEQGFEALLRDVLSRNIFMHAPFAREGTEPDDVRAGWAEAYSRYCELPILKADLKAAAKAFTEHSSSEGSDRLKSLKEQEMRTASANGEAPGPVEVNAAKLA